MVRREEVNTVTFYKEDAPSWWQDDRFAPPHTHTMTLLLQTQGRANMCILGVLFLPNQHIRMLEEKTVGLWREEEHIVPNPYQKQALFLRSSQNTHFSPKLSRINKASRAKMQTSLELSFQNLSLVLIANCILWTISPWITTINPKSVRRENCREQSPGGYSMGASGLEYRLGSGKDCCYVLENDVISQTHLLEHCEKYRFPSKLYPLFTLLSFPYTGINI